MKFNFRNFIIGFTVFAVFLFIDIITKNLIEANLSIYERVNIIGTFVQLTLIYNQGGIFGILQGYQNFFLIVSIIVLILLILYYIFEEHKTLLFNISIGLICAGAVGNILDRLLGKPGVVDFIYIGDDNIFRWPAFNVADSVIVVGAILLVIHQLKVEKEKKHKAEFKK